LPCCFTFFETCQKETKGNKALTPFGGAIKNPAQGSTIIAVGASYGNVAADNTEP
jgi:hypothetical protein